MLSIIPLFYSFYALYVSVSFNSFVTQFVFFFSFFYRCQLNSNVKSFHNEIANACVRDHSLTLILLERKQKIHGKRQRNFIYKVVNMKFFYRDYNVKRLHANLWIDRIWKVKKSNKNAVRTFYLWFVMNESQLARK